jgi:hypothetical protein
LTLKIVLDFLESDATHLNDRKVQEEITEFPWDARDRAITEIMLAVEGLRNRIRLIEAGCCTPYIRSGGLRRTSLAYR